VIGPTDGLLIVAASVAILLTLFIIAMWWKFLSRVGFYERQERITSASIKYIPELLRERGKDEIEDGIPREGCEMEEKEKTGEANQGR